MLKVKQLFDRILSPTHQLVFYLGGSGGTGKSRVIHTLIDFARRWDASKSLIISASSGVAATLIGGCTLHSALGIQRSLDPPNPTETQISNWSSIGMLFIDEFSMISAALFDLVDTRLRKLKCRMEMPFGGVHMVFSGDFYQLPPIGSTLYKTPSFYGKNNNALATIRGQQLWKTCLTDVIVLQTNLRQTDEAWAESLLRWRTNEPTLEDIRQVNSRVYSVDSTFSCIPKNTLTAVSDNRSRENGIRYSTTQLLTNQKTISQSDSDWRSCGVLMIRATVTCAKGRETLNDEQQEYIRNLPAKRLGAAGNLFCILNSDYIINRNEDVSKGIANGTTATFVDVVLKKEIQIQRITLGRHYVHAVNADQVLSLIFQHKSTTWRQSSTFSTLPEGCFPLISQCQKIKCRIGKERRLMTISVTQPPCELAHILTGHKMQGQTVKSIVLGNISKYHRNGQTGWLYVILSRVKNLSGLYLLTPLDENVKIYKPRSDVKIEMDRLQRLQYLSELRLSDALLNCT